MTVRTVIRAALLLAMLTALLSPAAASAYDGVTAATYADGHWWDCSSDVPGHSPPSPYVCISGGSAGDCTNFASQVMYAGDYPFVNNGYWDGTGLFDSWYWYSATRRTTSWTVAPELYTFLTHAEIVFGRSGGTLVKQTKGALAADKYNSLAKGDLIFFDWTDNGAIDHVRIETGFGTPPRTGFQSSYNNSYWTTGDWANQHTAARYHDFWNGYYQMDAATRASVRIFQVHIN